MRTAETIVAQREFADRLRRRTVPDPLTGQPVRTLLVDRLELLLAATGLHEGRLAVLFAELDGLGGLTAAHGPTAASAARAEAVGRLVSVVRQGDTVARIGSQTFLLLCPAVQAVADAEGIAERVVGAFAGPLRPGHGLLWPVRISVGMALSGREATPESMLGAAYEAMTSVRARVRTDEG